MSTPTACAEYAERDQTTTLVALTLDVHPITCHEIPLAQRALIAAAVESALLAIGGRS